VLSTHVGIDIDQHTIFSEASGNGGSSLTSLDPAFIGGVICGGQFHAFCRGLDGVRRIYTQYKGIYWVRDFLAEGMGKTVWGGIHPKARSGTAQPFWIPIE
jgi:hypothetical protein